MKRYRLDLSEYSVEVAVVKDNKVIEESTPYPLKQNLYQWLRLAGVYENGVEICDACDLAKTIKNAGDEITIDEYELKLLKRAMNTLIAQKADPTREIQPLGGPAHEEAIRRVFKAKEI